jgi:mannan polymerase II complex MNN10 subunit
MEWEHKEQDALEYMYQNQPWVRSHVAFISQRLINSFPPGACGDGNHPKIHYKSSDRDFLVNMAGCQWGRDCGGEMYAYRKLSEKLNRNVMQKLRDWVCDSFKNAFLTVQGKQMIEKEADKKLGVKKEEKKNKRKKKVYSRLRFLVFRRDGSPRRLPHCWFSLYTMSEARHRRMS